MSNSFRSNAVIVFNSMRGNANHALTFVLDAAGDWYAYGFILNESITLEKVAIRVKVKTGTPPDYDFEIQTDDGTGDPSGTLVDTNTSGTFTEASDITDDAWTSEVALTANATLVAGTLYWMVLKGASAPDGSNNIAVNENSKYGVVANGAQFGHFSLNGLTHFSKESTDSGTSWSVATGPGLFVLISSDGTPKTFGAVFNTSSTKTMSNTVWKGIKFIAPYDMNVWGMSITQRNSTSAAVTGFLINSSNVIIATGTNSAGLYDVVTGRGMEVPDYFDEEQLIIQGETYRIVQKDSAAAQRVDVMAVESVYKTLMPWNGDAIYTEGTSSDGSASPTSWTDVDTQLPAMGALLASAVTNSTVFIPRRQILPI